MMIDNRLPIGETTNKHVQLYLDLQVLNGRSRIFMKGTICL